MGNHTLQMDLQAHARCHRIGQTKEVKVFVMASVCPVELKILEV